MDSRRSAKILFQNRRRSIWPYGISHDCAWRAFLPSGCIFKPDWLAKPRASTPKRKSVKLVVKGVNHGYFGAVKTAIHWFRRDLRVSDNVALSEAYKRAETLIPVFTENILVPA